MGERKPPGADGADDRRGDTDTVLFIDPDPRLLRESLERVHDALAEVEPVAARRVERLVGQLIARVSELPGPRERLVQLRILVTPEVIRLEAEGPPTVLPYYADSDPVPPGRMPDWIVNELADRWGPDRRSGGNAAWFLILRDGRGGQVPVAT